MIGAKGRWIFLMNGTGMGLGFRVYRFGAAGR